MRSQCQFCSVMRFQKRSVLFLCSFTRFQGQSVLFHYEISMTVSFQWPSVLFLCEISMTVGFVLLWDFNDGWFCSFTRFRWQPVLFLNEILKMVGFVLFFYNILKTVSLWDFNNGWFCSFTRSQWQFYSFTRSQWCSVLFLYEILVMVGFVQSRDFNDCQFSMTVGFVVFLFWDLDDGCFFSHYEISKTVILFHYRVHWDLVKE